jgi:hypothetical protein
MKKQLIAVVLSSLVLAGCSAGSVNNRGSKGVNSMTEASSNSGSAVERKDVKTDFKALDPKTVPELSPGQKNQMDSTLNSTLISIDEALKALEDVPEIDLSSLEE